jgi:tetratricopeptide (TPR) repeat protein
VLTGSVRRAGTAVTVTAQLVAVGSGAVLWSENFEYQALENWNWQRDISRRVARAMDLRMLETAAAARRSSGRTLDAVDHFMEGWYIVRHVSTREDFLRARGHFEAALENDPEAVSALVGFSVTHLAEVLRRWSTDRQGQLAFSSAAVEKAIALDPTYTLAHVGRADILSIRGKFLEATREYETALEMNPSDAWSHSRLGLLKLQTGHAAEVARHEEQAQQLSPFENLVVRNAHLYAGMAEFHLEHDDAAYVRMRQVLALDPGFGYAWQWMAAIDALHGRTDKATANLAEFRRLNPNHTISSLRTAEASRNETYWIGENRFYEGLRKAGMPE